MNDKSTANLFDPPPERHPAAQAQDFTSIAAGAEQRAQQRGYRRALAVNGVQMARAHAGRDKEPFTQSDADVIMAITELLDRVTESQGRMR